MSYDYIIQLLRNNNNAYIELFNLSRVTLSGVSYVSM